MTKIITLNKRFLISKFAKVDCVNIQKKIEHMNNIIDPKEYIVDINVENDVDNVLNMFKK